jgi:hypothetical protein
VFDVNFSKEYFLSGGTLNHIWKRRNDARGVVLRIEILLFDYK